MFWRIRSRQPFQVHNFSRLKLLLFWRRRVCFDRLRQLLRSNLSGGEMNFGQTESRLPVTVSWLKESNGVSWGLKIPLHYLHLVHLRECIYMYLQRTKLPYKSANNVAPLWQSHPHHRVPIKPFSSCPPICFSPLSNFSCFGRAFAWPTLETAWDQLGEIELRHWKLNSFNCSMNLFKVYRNYSLKNESLYRFLTIGINCGFSNYSNYWNKLQ